MLFWPVVYTAVAAGFVYAGGRASGQVDMSAITSGAFLSRASLAHLWFLWDLMIFYAIAVALTPLGTRMPARVDSAFGWVATTLSGAVAMAVLSTVTLLPMQTAALDTSLALLPPVRVIVAYGVFFSFGWLLYRRRDVLETLGRRWKLPMLTGAVSSVAYLIVAVDQSIAAPRLAHVVGCALAALSIWMLIFGIVGAFLSQLAHPRPIVRYLSDASYWMYIVHLPLAIGVSGLLAPAALPAVLKFVITLTSVSALTLVSYHYLVRATAIGAVLNGRRYPRALPKAQPVPDVVGV